MPKIIAQARPRDRGGNGTVLQWRVATSRNPWAWRFALPRFLAPVPSLLVCGLVAKREFSRPSGSPVHDPDVSKAYGVAVILKCDRQ